MICRFLYFVSLINQIEFFSFSSETIFKRTKTRESNLSRYTRNDLSGLKDLFFWEAKTEGCLILKNKSFHKMSIYNHLNSKNVNLKQTWKCSHYEVGHYHQILNMDKVFKIWMTIIWISIPATLCCFSKCLLCKPKWNFCRNTEKNIY